MYYLIALLLTPALPLARTGKQTTAATLADDRSLHRSLHEAESEFRRGVQFADGDGALRDFEKAAFHYRNAAGKGYAPAQYNLAHLYEHGLGVREDLEQAALWYRRAAEQGDSQSQNNLGNLFATGRGVPKDDKEAARWYQRAAEQENPAALSNLANFYLNGRGVPRDPDKAFRLCSQAANRGYAIAQNNLALMYANGQGVAQDYAWAHAWLDLASEELESSAAIRDRMAKVMTAAQIALAKELAESKRKDIRSDKQ